MRIQSEGVFLKCVNCGAEHEASPHLFTCPKCGGLLEARLTRLQWSPRGRGVWRYRSMLPPVKGEPVTMGEGSTPLVKSRVYPGLYLKFEGSNPTGSFKDRGMTLATTIARDSGARAVIAASTGNTAASVAAYARRAGLTPYIFLPRGRVARGKILQSIAYGATIVWVEGSFDHALGIAMRLAFERPEYYPMNSINPWRLEGQKTLVYEVIEELGRTPTHFIYPVGNAGNISAGWKAARELMEAGVIEQMPRFHGVQAEGAKPIAEAFSKGLSQPVFTDHPETIASAIRIGRPVNWPKAMSAIKDSRGTAMSVGDEEILSAQRRLAREEGLIVEPASASAYAGYLKLLEEGVIERDEETVVVLTGHGLKDPASMELMKTGEAVITSNSSVDEVDRVLKSAASQS